VAYLAELRLQTPKGQESKIVLPERYRNQSEVAIYYTDFDRDGFLEFCLLAGAANREGEDARFYQLARQTYKTLWKEEFDGILYKELVPSPNAIPLPHPSLEGVRNVAGLTEEGIGLLSELSRLAADARSPISSLAKVNQEIQEIDKKLEEVGLSCPVLGALIRIFLMEKDNLRGDDVNVLASETKELYSTLARRGRRFANLFDHFDKTMQRTAL
jgi:hypothetical protein